MANEPFRRDAEDPSPMVLDGSELVLAEALIIFMIRTFWFGPQADGSRLQGWEPGELARA